LLFYGDRLAELREDAKWNQKKLASELSVTVPTISDYENGRTCPGLDKIINMAKLFNVSIDYLCGLTDDLISYKHDNDCIVLPQNCPPDMKKELLRQVELLKKDYNVK